MYAKRQVTITYPEENLNCEKRERERESIFY